MHERNILHLHSRQYTCIDYHTYVFFGRKQDTECKLIATFNTFKNFLNNIFSLLSMRGRVVSAVVLFLVMPLCLT